MPETCPDCGRPRVTREAPTSGGCLRSLTNDGGSILSHYSDAECYRLALARVKEERDRLQRERDEARRSKEFTDQWYACRFERLRKELDDKGEIGAKAYHAIVANGVGPGPEYEPPTYAQQLNTAIYRADAAEARASSLEKQLSEAQAQRDEALAHLLGKERCTQPCAICDERRASEIELAALRAQNATQHESVDTAMRLLHEERESWLRAVMYLHTDSMGVTCKACGLGLGDATRRQPCVCDPLRDRIAAMLHTPSLPKPDPDTAMRAEREARAEAIEEAAHLVETWAQDHLTVQPSFRRIAAAVRALAAPRTGAAARSAL